jgi:chaperonin cofactor prefoldin
MATQKKVRGHRANKPNDSFGTINSDNLYRGNYRKDVYEDDDDTPQNVEATEADPTNEEQSNESFATTKTEASPDHDYKKRYDDLKRHYDEKLKEFQQKEAELEERAKQKLQDSNVRLPKTAEELDKFKEQYPDVYGVVETVAAMQASERTTELQKEIESLREKEKNLEVQTAYRELKNAHPDFDELRKDEKFLAWLEEQPKNISDGIYKNNTDVKWAARVIDLYKVDAGITTKKKKTSTNDAAAAVSAPKARDVASENDGNKRIWKASQIAKMKPWEFEKLESELDSARAEGRIDFNN